jgi:hypothetical protein
MVAVLAPALLALVLTASGCGNGGTVQAVDYLGRISEIHDGVAWDLSYVLESLSGIPRDEYYHLEELRGLFDEARGIFAQAYRDADSLQPLPEAEELHADLLRFYREGEEKIGETVDSLGFFQAVLPMLADVQNLALPSLPEAATPEEIKAAGDEDRRTIDMYLSDLEGWRPPEGLLSYLERTRELFNALRDAIIGVQQAPPPEEQARLAQLREQYAVMAETARQLQDEVAGFLAGVGSSIDALIREGRELASRVQDLLGAPTATPPEKR